MYTEAYNLLLEACRMNGRSGNIMRLNKNFIMFITISIVCEQSRSFNVQSWPKLVEALAKSYLLDKLYSYFSDSGKPSSFRLPLPLPPKTMLICGWEGQI